MLARCKDVELFLPDQFIGSKDWLFFYMQPQPVNMRESGLKTRWKVVEVVKVGGYVVVLLQIFGIQKNRTNRLNNHDVGGVPNG